MATLQLRHTALALATAFLASACTDDDDAGTAGSGAGGGATQTIGNRLETLGLTTLTAAIEAAGLTETINGPGPLTIFAPTNAAFEALGSDTLNALLDPANQDALIDVLTYHVTGSDLDAAMVAAEDSLTMLNEGQVIVDAFGPLVLLNDASVVDANQAASNGTIHVIDTVLRPPVSLIETLNQRGYTTLATAIDAAGLSGALTGANVGLFAPSNEAFAALPAGVLDDLLLPENIGALQDILTFHVGSDPIKGSALLAAGSGTSLDGRPQFFGADGLALTVNGVPITQLNLPATDGIIHGIDSVLAVPRNLLDTASDLGLSTLVAAVGAADLDETLATGGPFTLFGPTDQAFAELGSAVDDLLLPENQADLVNVLQYHLLGSAMQADLIRLEEQVTALQGDSIDVNPLPGVLNLNSGPSVLTYDVYCSNGILHVINGVLLPPMP